jgi:hypothetical protein
VVATLFPLIISGLHLRQCYIPPARKRSDSLDALPATTLSTMPKARNVYGQYRLASYELDIEFGTSVSFA